MVNYEKYEHLQNIISKDDLWKLIEKGDPEFFCFVTQKFRYKVDDIELDLEQPNFFNEIYSDNLGLKQSFNVIIFYNLKPQTF